MNRQQRRATATKERKVLKKGTPVKNGFGLDFTLQVSDDLSYDAFAVIGENGLKAIAKADYDTEKCLDIVLEHSQNIFAMKNGASISTEAEREQVIGSVRVVMLAAARLLLLDPYRNPMVRSGYTLKTTLAYDEDHDAWGFDNIPGTDHSMIMATAGVPSAKKWSKDHEGFYITIG